MQKYRVKNLKVFPAVWAAGTFQAKVKWSTQATDDEETIKKWRKQFPTSTLCIALAQSKLTVLDIDIKKGKRGEASLKELESRNKKIPSTLTVRTPSGGKHYYFRGVSRNTYSKIGSGIDTPVMAPLPNSEVVGKGSYKIIKDVPIAELPKWLERLIGQKKEKEAGASGRETAVKKEELDTEQSIAKAIEFLSTTDKISIEGEGGDGTAYIIACAVRDMGLSKEKALTLMGRHWNRRCIPPWAFEDLEKKVTNAYLYAESKLGEHTAVYHFKIKQEEQERKVKRSKGLEQFTDPPPPREWLVKNLIPLREVTLVYGNGCTGKSLLMGLQLPLTISDPVKKSFLGKAAENVMPSLVVACEDTYSEIHRRIWDIRNAEGYDKIPDTAEINLWSRVGEATVLAEQSQNKILRGEFFNELVEEIRLIKGNNEHCLVILDTMSDVFAVDENERHAAGVCIKTVLGSLIKNLGCTIVALAHPSKISMRAGIFDSGSTGWRNSCRAMLSLKTVPDKKQPNKRILTVMKSNYAGVGEQTIVEWKEGCFQHIENETLDSEKQQKENAVYEIIEKANRNSSSLSLHHRSKNHILNATIINNGEELTKAEIGSAIQSLLKKGLIKTVKNEIWNSFLWEEKRRVDKE